MAVAREELAFVERAYAVTLGRAVDPIGLRDYLRRRQAGWSADDLLRDLQGSDEALTAPTADGAASAATLERLLRLRPDAEFVRRSTFTLTGRCLDASGVEREKSTLAGQPSRLAYLQALRRSDAGSAYRSALIDVHVLDLMPAELRADVTTLERVLAVTDEAFVHLAYRCLLGRNPDRQGRSQMLQALRDGTSRLRLLHGLRRSDEGRASTPGVRGLPAREGFVARAACSLRRLLRPRQ